MSINHIGTYTLPNVYFERVVVGSEVQSVDVPFGFTATFRKTSFNIDLCILDYFTLQKNFYTTRDVFRTFMDINVVAISDKTLIDRINSGELLIPDFACKKYKITDFINNGFQVSPIDNQLAIYRYNANFTLSEEERHRENIFVYAFASMDIDAMENQLNLNLDFSDNKFMRGPLSSECVLRNGNVPEHTHQYYKVSDNSLWAGPIRKRLVNGQVQIRGGPFSEANSPLLREEKVDNNKVFLMSQMPIPTDEELMVGTLQITDSDNPSRTVPGDPTYAVDSVGTNLSQIENPNMSLAERFLKVQRLIE